MQVLLAQGQFWIFPNLTDDKLGVIDSFKPLYEIKKREDKLISILIRVAVAIGICTGTVYLYQNPELINDVRFLHNLILDTLHPYKNMDKIMMLKIFY